MSATRWWSLALLAVAALAFIAGRWTAAPAAAPDPLRSIDEIKLDWLGLTPEQTEQIAGFHSRYTQSVRTGCDAQCVARCRLVHTLMSEVWDEDRARAALEAKCEAQRATEFATLDFLARLHAVLKPEQRTRLMTRVGRCLCEPCAAGKDSCCATTGDPS